MPALLSDSISDQLKSPATALAALLVIANHHRDALLWVARTVGDSPARPRGEAPAKSPRSNGDGRRAQRDRDDEALISAMKAAPGGAIGDWAAAIGKSRTSTVAGLHRLRDADLAESVEGKWRLVEEQPARPAAGWTEPVSATHRAHAHA
jgi:hypothetical protein